MLGRLTKSVLYIIQLCILLSASIVWIDNSKTFVRSI